MSRVQRFMDWSLRIIGCRSGVLEFIKRVSESALPEESNGEWIWWIFTLIMDPLILYVPTIKPDKKSLHFNLPLLITPFVLTFTMSYAVSFIIHFKKTRQQQLFFHLMRTFLMMSTIIILNVYLVLIYFLRPAMLFTYSALPIYMIGILVLFYLIKVFGIYRTVLKRSVSLKIGINFAFFLYGGHVFGGLWYFLAVFEKMRCWNKACIRKKDCQFKNRSFLVNSGNYTFFENMCSDTSNNTFFDFGIFKEAIEKCMVDTLNLKKILYGFRWGIQNISGFGQNLEVGTYGLENIFVIFLAIYGILTFTCLIGSMQDLFNSQSKQTSRWGAKSLRKCSFFKNLSKEDQDMIIKRCRQSNWPQLQPINFQNLLTNLPEGVKTDIKRIFCSKLLEKIQVFKNWSMEWTTQVYDHIKPVVYEIEDIIIKNGNAIDELVLVLEGKLEIKSYQTGSTIPSSTIQVEEECLSGEELVTWFDNDPDSSQLPISSKSIKVLKEVHAFVITSEDLQNLIKSYKASSSASQQNSHIINNL